MVTTATESGQLPTASAPTKPQKPLNELFCSLPTTIFEVMSKLAVEHNSVNLGQGFPDEEGPASMKQIASSAMDDFHNQ
ncbi:aminotran_1_2 domain-containing protein, partial [Haematococcus lacustris]